MVRGHKKSKGINNSWEWFKVNKAYFLKLFEESKEVIESELSEIENKRDEFSKIEYIERVSFCKGKLHTVKAYIKAFETS